MLETKHMYDLEQRTVHFGERIIALCRSLKRDPVALPLVAQIVRSGTSIGANYMEANGGNSRKEFSYKIALCKKESNETKYWIKMLLPFCDDNNREEMMRLGKEAQELTLIFQKIGLSMKAKE